MKVLCAAREAGVLLACEQNKMISRRVNVLLNLFSSAQKFAANQPQPELKRHVEEITLLLLNKLILIHLLARALNVLR